MWSIMLNYVIYQHYCHYIDVITLEWYLISFLLIIIVFLFHYRGEHELEHDKDIRWNGNKCKHVGPVDPVGSSYQMSVLSTLMIILPDVMYSTMLYIWTYTVI